MEQCLSTSHRLQIIRCSTVKACSRAFLSTPPVKLGFGACATALLRAQEFRFYASDFRIVVPMSSQTYGMCMCSLLSFLLHCLVQDHWPDADGSFRINSQYSDPTQVSHAPTHWSLWESLPELFDKDKGLKDKIKVDPLTTASHSTHQMLRQISSVT